MEKAFNGYPLPKDFKRIQNFRVNTKEQESAKKYYKNTGRKPKSMATSGLLLPRTSRPVKTLKSTFLPEDSHASRSAKPDEEKERQMTASSGPRCLGLFESLDPAGSLVKMLRDYLLSSKAWYSNKCALTWKRKDTKSSRLLFQLSPSMRHIGGIGSGLLPTARTISGGTDNSAKKIRPSGHHGTTNLQGFIQMLPTPRAGGQADTARSENRTGNRHAGDDTTTAVGKATGLRLQPAFVEWMMGYPQGWTDLNLPSQHTAGKGLNRSATPSSRRSQSK